MVRNLTRRLFLRGAAVAAPLAAIPAVAAVSLPGDLETAPAFAPVPVKADAELFRLAKGYRAAMRRWRAARRAEDDAEARFDAIKPPPFEIGYRMSEEERAAFLAATIGETRLGNWPPAVNEFFERENRLRTEGEAARAEAVRKAERDSGLAAAKVERWKAWRTVCRHAEKLFRSRASTLDGLLLKVRIHAKDEYDETLFAREIAKDLRALKRAGVVLATKGGRAGA